MMVPLPARTLFGQNTKERVACSALEIVEPISIALERLGDHVQPQFGLGRGIEIDGRNLREHVGGLVGPELESAKVIRTVA